MKNLKNLKKVLTRNNRLAVLDNALISSGRIYSSDLEIFMSYPTEIIGEGLVDLRILADTEMGNSAYFQDGQLLIKRGNNISRISAGGDVKDYPKIPETPINLGVITDISELKKMLPFVSKDEFRPALNGIFLGKNIACATDANLLIFQMRIESEVKEIIIPSRAINLLDEEEYSVSVDKNKTYLRLLGQKQELICRLIDGKYPNFLQVIPKECCVISQVNHKELINAITSALPFTNKNTNLIKLSFDKEGLTVSAEDLDRALEFNTKIKANWPYSIRRFSIGFDVKLLLTCLNAIKGQEYVPFYMEAANRAVIIGDNTLLMPKMLKDSFSSGWYGENSPEKVIKTPGANLPDFMYDAEKPTAAITGAKSSINKKQKMGNFSQGVSECAIITDPAIESECAVIADPAIESECAVIADPAIESERAVIADPAEPINKPDVRIIIYSEKGFAVVGDVEPIKQMLIDNWGSYKKHITFEGQKFEGYVFSLKRINKIKTLINQ